MLTIKQITKPNAAKIAIFLNFWIYSEDKAYTVVFNNR